MTLAKPVSKMKTLNLKVLSLSAALVLAACDGDDNDSEIRALENRVGDLELRLMLSEEHDANLSASLESIEARLAELENNDDIDDELQSLAALLDQLESRLEALESIHASEYEITLTNVSANQPLAPAAVMLHYSDYRAWQIGNPASAALETLAESGNPNALIEAASTTQDARSSTELLAPGESVSLRLSAVWREDLALTAASMPVNTNDAFSGTSGLAIAALAPEQGLTALLPVYDAGTEFNSESAETIPGPAAGGEGYNPERDDLNDTVTRHPGVVTQAGGHSESALDESHRFDQGILHVRVQRLATTE